MTRSPEIAGVKKEMHSMLDFEVFYEERVDQLTQEQLDNAISTKWVKTRKPDGSVRCRLVRGLDQKVEDLDDTFASTTLKLLLTLAASFIWTVTCGDISTALILHALISGEDIRVITPPEFYSDNLIWKLRHALYGLGNAPRLWQDHFASVTEKNNFKRMKSDPKLHVRKHKRLYVLCHVDDLMFFGSLQ